MTKVNGKNLGERADTLVRPATSYDVAFPSAIIPVETLFRMPSFSSAKISPDGTKLAFLASWRGRLNIFVDDLGSTNRIKAHRSRRVTHDKRRNIEMFCWTADSNYILFIRDTQGDENWHLHSVEVGKPGGRTVNLTPFPGVRVTDLAFDPDDAGSIFIQMNARTPYFMDLHRLNLETGGIVMIAENPGRFVRWLPIPGGAAYAIVINSMGDYELSRYVDGSFEAIASFSGRDLPLGPLPCVPTPDGKGLWIGSNRGTDRTRVVRIDLATGQEAEVDNHPEFDLDTPRPDADPRFPSSLILNPVTGVLLGGRYLGETQVIHALDARFDEVLKAVEPLVDGEVGPVSCDRAGTRWIIETMGDRNPGTTWFYDHYTGECSILGCRNPELDLDTLAIVRPFTVFSRDGLPLPCHLTLPVALEPRNLPTVVLVHGGPWYRDAAVFDPEVQLLANRGYAVLQVNFRGSTGYGKAFMQAARHEFAGRMHDDLLDALDHVIANGIADRDRVAIYGCSYGGYAALVGATFTPDRFAAAISYSGMSDLRALVQEAVPFIRETLVNSYIAYMGDPEIALENEDMLARSPVSRLDQVRCPVLVIHGTQDVRVSLSQAEKVVYSIRGHGGEVECLVNENEGHWFINQESIVELYETIVSFLDRQIRGASAEHAEGS